jgi:hypothetical protein
VAEIGGGKSEGASEGAFVDAAVDVAEAFLVDGTSY